MSQEGGPATAAAQILKVMGYLGAGHWPKPGVDWVTSLVLANDPQSTKVRQLAIDML